MYIQSVGYWIQYSAFGSQNFCLQSSRSLAQSYIETPVILSASEVLPAGVIKGSNYSVAEKVVEHADDVLFND
jgi:hypothetical protein